MSFSHIKNNLNWLKTVDIKCFLLLCLIGNIVINILVLVHDNDNNYSFEHNDRIRLRRNIILLQYVYRD